MPSFRSFEPGENSRHDLAISGKETASLVHHDPQLHLAPPNSEGLGGAIVIPRFSNNLFRGARRRCGCPGGFGSKALLCIGKGLDTVLQVDLPLRKLKENILEGILVVTLLLIHRLIWVITGVGSASGTCRVEAASAKRTATREREGGFCFDVVAGVVEEEVCKGVDNEVVATEGGVHLLDPLEVCFSGSFLSSVETVLSLGV